MLLGEYEHTIDDKNRLTLPAKFRQAFADGVVVTRGMDGCLYAYTREGWENIVAQRLGNLDTLSREARAMQRFFFSGSSDQEPDKPGRIWITAAPQTHAQLG